VGEAMREALGELIQRHVKDPRVGFVTITAVRVTPDLGKAHVYYTVLGDPADQADTQAGLESAAPFLRAETGRRVRLKTLPELEFHLDDTPVRAQKVDSILEEIHRTEAAHPGLYLPPLPAEVETALQRAVGLIDAAESIAIACHLSPDGDALGCVLALALALKDRGIELLAGWDGEHVELPSQYDFLPGAELLTQASDFRPTDVAIALDCASADRLGALRERFERSGALINLDHHVSNTRFGGVDVVDEHASSSAELVVQLIARLGAEITPDIATCLYTGLVTDAGRFSYRSVTPRTHATAGFLIQRGVVVDEISQRLYESFPFAYLKILGRALERARLERELDFVVSHLTQADLRELGVTMDDTDEVINTLRAIRDVDVTLLYKELEDGTWKGSLRSKGATDVGAIAQRFGGGGHTLAAGFEVEMSLDEAIDAVRRALAER
jgi:phosphoesterase RecJ-like protein